SSRAPDRATNRSRGLRHDGQWRGGRSLGKRARQRRRDYLARRPTSAVAARYQRSLVEAGRLMWKHRGQRLFAVGSQGVEQALVAYWQSAGLIPDTRPSGSLAAVKRIACISGSCSPVTAEQIDHAARHGFEIV